MTGCFIFWSLAVAVLKHSQVMAMELEDLTADAMRCCHQLLVANSYKDRVGRSGWGAFVLDICHVVRDGHGIRVICPRRVAKEGACCSIGCQGCEPCQTDTIVFSLRLLRRMLETSSRQQSPNTLRRGLWSTAPMSSVQPSTKKLGFVESIDNSMGFPFNRCIA